MEKELKSLLEEIKDSYDDFIMWGCACCKTDEERLKIIDYIKSKDDVTTSDVLDYYFDEVKMARNRS